MVVHTHDRRVKEAQEAVLEFLLINHPLDCPVCDKGGECPLQDTSFGWGGGISRFVEPKRHFEKPLALQPADRDRPRALHPLLPLRALQPGGQRGRPAGPPRARRAHLRRRPSTGIPYVAPFSGNIIELCPVGALTSRPYRFRARPWDIEQSGSVCTLCPAQCNISLTVRDERALRVLARDNPDVDDGWLCDKGRFAYQAIHVRRAHHEPLLRDGGELRPVSWERAIDGGRLGARPRARRASARSSAANHQRGGLARAEARARGARLGRHRLARRRHAPARPAPRAHAPALQAEVPDLEFAHAVLVLDTEPVDDAPILDLRIRKGVRRSGVKLFVATSRQSSLDDRAEQSIRFAPGAGEALLAALDGALAGAPADDVARLAADAGTDGDAVAALAKALRGAGGRDDAEVVILFGERLTARSARRARGARAAERRRASRPRRPRRRRPARGAGRRQRPRAARGRRAAERRPGPLRGRGAGRDAAGDRAGRDRRRADGALPDAHRPADGPAGPRRLGPGAGEGDHRRSPTRTT